MGKATNEACCGVYACDCSSALSASTGGESGTASGATLRQPQSAAKAARSPAGATQPGARSPMMNLSTAACSARKPGWCSGKKKGSSLPVVL
jgi:hypothetical protein